jgi:hypothetical protein
MWPQQLRQRGHGTGVIRNASPDAQRETLIVSVSGVPAPPHGSLATFTD